MNRPAIIFCLLVACAAASPDAGRRGLAAEDCLAIDSPADPHISPDGKMVAYTVATIDAKQNRRQTAVWLVPIDGSGEPRQFTTGESANSPRWSPDGRILAFISGRGASGAGASKAQVYALSMSGGDLFQNFDLYWKYSPVHSANDVKTPTLIVRGQTDQRVELEQDEQFFRSLRHFGVTAEFVIYPREGHALRSEPKHAAALAKWQVYWFERFVDGNTNAVRPGGY